MVRKKKDYGKIIDKIEKIRGKNNTTWMNIVRIAFKHAPEETARVISKIYSYDQKISDLVKKLN